jgi:hypothetical protein
MDLEDITAGAIAHAKALPVDDGVEDFNGQLVVL